MRKKFLRQDSIRHFRIGMNRKKLQKWRKPKGRHSKMRQKRTGYPRTVSIGYRNNRAERGNIMGMKPILIFNSNQLNSIKKNNIVMIAKVGAKNKLEIIKKAAEKRIRLANLPGEVKQDAIK